MTTIQSEGAAIKGILGTKLGMTQVFDANNKIVPVTVIQAGPCVITEIRTVEKDGYSAIQFAFGAVDPRKVTKPVAGQFAKAGVTPRNEIAELRISDTSSYSIGQEITAEIFAAGELIDATGTSRGKGTAGVMKRHGFGGIGASHGVDRKHRMSGSIGNRTTPGRVFKGKRMMGSMGDEQVTTQNLKVHAIDVEKGLILVKGAVPGATKSTVFLRSAAKHAVSTHVNKAGA
jgi:large subunit ribosomal protein L3